MHCEQRPLLQRLTPVLAGMVWLASGPCHAQSNTAPASRVTPVTVTTSTAARPVVSPSSTYEQQLQAIRQALLEATLETAPTQVISSSWIDSTGALRETHEFNSRAEVRGIRLVPPDEEASKAPKVSVEVLPWGWRHDAKAGQECTPAPRTWRLPLRVTTQLAPGIAGPQLAASQALLRSTELQTHNALQRSTHWLAIASAPPAPSNAYLRALGKATEPVATPWQLTLVLEPQAPTANAVVTWVQNTTGIGLPLVPAPPSQWLLHLSLNSSSRASVAAAGWQQDIVLSADTDKLSEHPTQWLAAVESDLASQLGTWIDGIDKQLQCEPTPFVVRHQNNALVLLAGQGSGLRPGDRVLLMQPGWVPSRMLDPRAVEHLTLAEVVRVGAQLTELRQLAGLPLPMGGEWVALPL